MKFIVYNKAQDAGWLRDWHGPFPFRVWAWLAGVVAWVRGGGSV